MRRVLGRLLGLRGEDRAAQYLEKLGYRVVARNYHTKGGELDIVATKDDLLCFVEVRVRSSASRGSAAESVSRVKRQRIARAAAAYLAAAAKGEPNCRFDVVAIDGDDVTFLPDAFRMEDC